ncbi:hypothetical protein INS49_002964 [Diaporthe citri]|uniref:uncharacterized protein n=1 Tax=Diaporthe citri TaxID=83186 RepID=UPI001C7F4BC8|nr:uncharacterized protein INS49_002964 [Diaporthe citri]KAG6368750.1 hypothetical protein INS49_002964 [Diaporthe citri]
MEQATKQTLKDDYEVASRLMRRHQLEPTVEEFMSLVQPILHEELPTVRSEIRQRAERIFDNWRSLESIVQRHEATIQKRWMNKSLMKRRELILTTWPNMARDHRPDIVLENKSCSPRELKKEKKLLLQGKRTQYKMYEGSQREALLMPYINLHDLTKSEPLLLMINARARQPPHAFSRRDLQLSTQGVWLTKWRSLEGYVMDFDGRQSGPETYGELREGEWKNLVSSTGADTRLANGTINPGDGLWILEIQDRIYKFVYDTVIRILHDIPTGDLTGPKYSIQPEPPLPSANSRADSVVSLATTNLEAIYSPPGKMDLRRLQLLVTAKANEEEDKLWALREDPGRFSEGLKEFIAHQPEYVADLLGAQHPVTTIDGCRKHYGSHITNLEDLFSFLFLLSNFRSVEFWVGLERDITDLVELQKQHFGSKIIESGDPLPEPFAMALGKFESTLCKCVEERLFILRRAAYSSPPLRPYVRRASPDSIDHFNSCSGKRPPQHILDFMSILFRLFQQDSLMSKGHICGVQSLMEQYDMFINTVPDAQEAVSSYVAQEISTLALLSECLRQIHLFQPWATTAHREVETPHVQDTPVAHHYGEECEEFPPKELRLSVQVWTMASDVAKSPYPVHKKRTAMNVDAMQKAEALLDQMWAAMLGEMEEHDSLKPHCKKVLFFQGRQLQRTPDWVEPVTSTKKTPHQIASPEVLVQSFGGLNIDDNKVENFPIEKIKVKTRGTPAPQASASTQDEETEQEDQDPARIIQVDRRALKVFGALFHTPSSTSKPGEVPWTEFLHAMRSAGFRIEKLYGSVWQFTPHDDSDGHVGAGMRSILFHEPHPHSKIPFWDARRHGRRLTRAYGWSGETFVAR